MSLIALVIIVACIGLALWAITTYIPMPDAIKKLLIVVGILVCLLLVMDAFGVLDSLKSVRVPQIN